MSDVYLGAIAVVSVLALLLLFLHRARYIAHDLATVLPRGTGRFFAYALLNGLMLGVIVTAYTVDSTNNAGASAVVTAFLGASAIFADRSACAYAAFFNRHHPIG